MTGMLRPLKCATHLAVISAVIVFICSACDFNKETRFERLSADETGVQFINELNPTPELNIFNYLYFYDGGGVAAGDLNGDGLTDLFFTANQGKNRLYLNQSDLQFEDITDSAFDTEVDDWTTGVSLVDINDDGRLDIYVSNVGKYLEVEGVNKLFVNQGNTADGIPVFEEQASEYGLDLVGFSTQAAFFDYDLDGDLDLYMMNHSVHSNATFDYSDIREESHHLGGDRLMRNDGGKYVDVTEAAGIYNSALGYGLGLAISDFNNDRLPDIYIGNDFHEDDYLYLNNGDGTFEESLGEMIQHTSRSSMGNDVIDINNDGLMDILSVDMLPRDYEMLKTSAAEDPYKIYQTKLKYGYKHQHSRNTLQLNRGNNKFSEIGLLSDVYATDWSWAALGADFNHNGHNDLFISNGIKGRTNALDYIEFISQDHIQKRLEGQMSEEELKYTDKMPAVKLPNYMYMNKGDLQFEDVSESWGLDHPTYSSGAAYADLDGDGDLEIIVNNVDQEAMIFKNKTMEMAPNSNYLKLRFNGPDGNRHGIGTSVTIPDVNGEIISREFYPVRGYQSSVDYQVHMGLDTLTVLPEVEVTWPDGRTEVLHDVEANQTLLVDYQHAGGRKDNVEIKSDTAPVVTEITQQLDISYRHDENDFVEFNREALIPHMISREGPAVAVGDVNGDGLDDIFAGGAKRQPSRLLIQEAGGTFKEKDNAALENDFIYEDVDAVFLDVEGDGDQDLVVVSGGNEYYGRSEYMQPRLYINDGEGNLVRDTHRFPNIYLTGSVVAAGDADNDGDVDLFIGARAIPWKYGMPPESYLLVNDNGTFSVDTTSLGQTVADLAMVTDAGWADMNGDGYTDLVVASEWSDLKIVYNQSPDEAASIPETAGLWNTLHTGDFDRDGTVDIAAGNLGLNSKFRASGEKPMRMYVDDFDDNGSAEQIITYIDDNGKERLFATRAELAQQLDYIETEFPTNESFAKASLTEVVDETRLESARTYTLTELQSAVFYNQGDSGFRKEVFPVQAQMAPVYDFLAYDFDRDHDDDLFAAGNMFHANIQRGRYDAGYGALLSNRQEGFTFVENRKTGWYLEGQICQLEVITIDNREVILAAENDQPLRFFAINNPSSTLITNKK